MRIIPLFVIATLVVFAIIGMNAMKAASSPEANEPANTIRYTPPAPRSNQSSILREPIKGGYDESFMKLCLDPAVGRSYDECVKRIQETAND